MKNYTCIIIDDEPLAIKWITDYVNSMPNLMLIKAYTNPLEALADLSGSVSVDLVLLDIKMPLISGIDLSRKIRAKTKKLVFTTAYKRFGYEAFEAEADAFLLKPYSLSKFAATIGKLFPEGNQYPSEPGPTDFFFAKNNIDNYKLVKVRYLDIVAVESKQNYIMIHTTETKILTHMSLTEISKILNKFSGFAQFQRSFIVGKNHIEHINGNTIKMINGLEISVGDYYRKDFLAFLADKVLKGRT
jgi:DNA-binding LytR/AlgR family response regulator